MRRILILVLASVAAHLYGIASPPIDYHWHRQVNTAAIARNYHEGAPLLKPRIDWEGDSTAHGGTELPLYMYLTGLLWGVFGLGDLWGRLLSVLFSAATAAVLFLFLRRKIPEEPAFWGSLLFTALPVEVYFGRTIQPEALALLASAACLLALDRYLDKGRLAARAGWWAAAVLAAALAVGHKIPYAYLFGVCAVLAWSRRGAAALRDPGMLAFFTFAAALVLAWYKHASAGSYVVPTEKSVFWELLDYGHLPYYIQFQFLSRFPELAATWPGMALFIAGIRAARSLPQETWRFLWGWFACVAVYAALGGGYVHHHEYTALPWTLVIAPLLGLGLTDLLRRARALPAPRRQTALAGLAALVLAVPAYTAVRIGHWYRLHEPDIMTMAGPVARISKPDDLFICNERASSVFLYYIRRRGWSEGIHELKSPLEEWLEKRMAKGGKFYMTRRAGVFSDPAHPLARHFFDRFPVIYQDDKFLIFQLKA